MVSTKNSDIAYGNYYIFNCIADFICFLNKLIIHHHVNLHTQLRVSTFSCVSWKLTLLRNIEETCLAH